MNYFSYNSVDATSNARKISLPALYPDLLEASKIKSIT